jgi:hypothetical protein
MARVALASLADARYRQIPAASLLGGDCLGTANVALLSVGYTNSTLVIEALLARRCGLRVHFSRGVPSVSRECGQLRATAAFKTSAPKSLSKCDDD